jgi:hypothetical protein
LDELISEGAINLMKIFLSNADFQLENCTKKVKKNSINGSRRKNKEVQKQKKPKEPNKPR